MVVVLLDLNKFITMYEAVSDSQLSERLLVSLFELIDQDQRGSVRYLICCVIEPEVLISYSEHDTITYSSLHGIVNSLLDVHSCMYHTLLRVTADITDTSGYLNKYNLQKVMQRETLGMIMQRGIYHLV